MMNGGLIRVYSGTIPSSPDGAPVGTELGRITTDGLEFMFPGDPLGAGLMLSSASPGILTNSGNWRLKGIVSGTAGWWRWCWAIEDLQAYSTYYPRVDGVLGDELVLNTSSITPSTNVLIESFSIVLGVGA
jgi:hypothetical protein